MPKNKLTEYDSTAANNTDVGGVNLAENSMLPSDVNNALREILSHLREFADGTSGINVLSLIDDDDSHAIKFQGPSSITANTTFTLPDGDGSADQYIKTDGSGTLSWVSPASEIQYLSGVTSNIQTQIDNIAGYPQVITLLTSGSSYTIPSGAQAILIKASGGGGSGGASQFSGNFTSDGNTGGQTTVTNSTLGINMVVKGGASGRGSTSGTATVLTGDSGLSGLIRGGGAAGGAPGMNNFDISCSFGGNGNLGQVYVTGSNVGGEVLTYSLGAGGAAATAGSTTSAPGQNGYLEITVW
jgi:hypothetical protein